MCGDLFQFDMRLKLNAFEGCVCCYFCFDNKMACRENQNDVDQCNRANDSVQSATVCTVWCVQHLFRIRYSTIKFVFDAFNVERMKYIVIWWLWWPKTSSHCQALHLMLIFPRFLRILNKWQLSLSISLHLMCANYKLHATRWKFYHTLLFVSCFFSKYLELSKTMMMMTPCNIMIPENEKARTTITRENINGIGKCQANSSYVDDHVITWMHVAL